MVEKNEAGLYEVKVDEHTYEFEKWGAEEALANLLKLSKLVGRPLGMAMASFGKDEGKGLFDQEVNMDMMGLAFEALTSNLDEAMAISLIKKLSSQGVFCDKAKITFNVHYQDRLDHMFKVVYAALEVQYGNFFGAVLGIVGKGKKPLAKHRA